MKGGLKPLKMPKAPPIKGGGRLHSMAKVPQGTDTLRLLKRFFLYRNVFGNVGGAGIPPGGDPDKFKPEKGEGATSVGNTAMLAAGRRMGIL